MMNKIKLGDIFKINSWKSVPKNNKSGIYNIYWSNWIIWKTDKFINKWNVLITWRVGTIWNVFLIKENFYPSDNVLVLSPKIDVDLNYFKYLLLNTNLQRYNTGTAQPLITQTTLQSLSFYIPSLEEQKKIATILSTLDQSIGLSDELIKKYEGIKEGMIKDLILQNNTLIEQDFVDVVEILDTKRKPISSKNRNNWVIPYYGATGKTGSIDSYIFNEELVLLAEDGWDFLQKVKKPAYKISGKSWVNNHAHVLRGKNWLSNNWLCYFLNTIDYSDKVSGTTRMKLNQSKMKEIIIRYPKDISEQNRIVNILTTIDSKIDLEKQSMEKNKLMKIWLMNEIFTGKKKVSI